MDNTFYQTFDRARHFESSKDQKEEIRSPFQVDRDRIVFSYAFRRLQSKTQVFQSGEFDFYRTRLTHSIEVAKIARSITEYLNHQSPELNDGFHIDCDLVEAVGMAHDLGHPPFGHIGERKLNRLMGPYGGFEGNAQTLRILTRLFYSRPDGSRGMNPTRALVDGVLKYKTLFNTGCRFREDGSVHYPENHFLYDADDSWLDFALGSRTEAVRTYCREQGLSLNSFRSIECQIMDWADDTAYSINVIIDSIQAGYLTPNRMEKWAGEQELNADELACIEELTRVTADSHYEAFLNRQIGRYIHGIHLEKRDNPMAGLSNRYRFTLKIAPEFQLKARLYKRLAVDLIFNSTQIHRIEYKGALLLERLFDALRDNYLNPEREPRLNLIPHRFAVQLQASESEQESMRILCDSLSEMTDALAIRTYKQLFDPDFGSILDIV